MPISLQAHRRFLEEFETLSRTRQLAVLECLRKLQRRQWDGGLRAKLLQGFSRRIWEARVDRGDRLIFSFTSGANAELADDAIVAWAVVKHDDVDRSSRRRFEGALKPLEAIFSIEAGVAAATDSAGEFEAWITQELEADAGVPFLADALPDCRVLGDDEWARRVLQGVPTTLDHLTEEQQAVAGLHGSVLLSGSAGSGKSTILSFQLRDWLSTPVSRPALYLTYNQLLVERARASLESIVGSVARTDAALLERIRFMTVSSLLSSLLAEAGLDGTPHSALSFSEYEKLPTIREQTTIRPAASWSEIRSIIKGAWLQTKSPMMDWNEYKRVGNIRAGDLASWRKEIFRLAERYQEQLDKKRRYDELDLVRAVLKNLPATVRQTYDAVFCDETQDLTELHLELLAALLHPNGKAFFAGDMNQIIVPSGFRWHEVQQRFKQLSPTHAHLAVNFRSVGTIVEFANSALDLRARLIHDAGQSRETKFILAGTPVAAVDAESPELASRFARIDGDFAVLVRSAEERERLKAAGGSPYVFTVEEAKGLEWDSVLIWDFFRPELPLWEKAVRSGVDASKRPALRYELSLLYVAATRPRRRLFIFDPTGTIAKIPELAAQVVYVGATEVDSSGPMAPSAWVDRGRAYLAHGFYEQAAVAFESGGASRDAHIAWARHFERDGKWSLAVRHYMDGGDPASAAPLLERDGQWGAAAEQFLALGDATRAERCLAEAAEQTGRYQEAAERWLAAGDSPRARQAAKRSQDARTIATIEARILQREGRIDEAAERLLAAGEAQEAAEVLHASGRLERAAQAYRLAGNEELARDLEVQALAAEGFVAEGGVHIVRPTESLQATLAAAQPGDLVLIEGNHEGAIVLPPGVTLAGRRAGARLTAGTSPVVTIEGPGRAMVRGLVVRLTGAHQISWASYERFDVDVAGTACAIRVRGGAADIQDCEIESPAAGIVVEGESDAALGENRLTKCKGIGVIWGGRAVGRMDRNHVSGCLVGIMVTSDATPDLTENHIEANQTCGIGYQCRGAGRAVGNVVQLNRRFGILVAGEAAPLLERNRLAQNTFSGLLFDESASGLARLNEINHNSGNGVDVSGQAEPRIEENDIQLNRQSGVTCAGRGHPVIRANAIAANYVDGIQVQQTATPSIESNVIKENKGHGIIVIGDAVPNVINNDLTSNGKSGLVYGGRSKGRAAKNRSTDHSLCGINVDEDANPELVENTATGSGVAGVSYLGNAGGQARGNTCVKSSKGYGFFLSDRAQPDLVENLVALNAFSIVYQRQAGGSARRNMIRDNANQDIQVLESALPVLENNELIISNNYRSQSGSSLELDNLTARAATAAGTTWADPVIEKLAARIAQAKNRQEIVEAIGLMRAAAERGDPNAKYQLWIAHAAGAVPDVSSEQAFVWLREAAEAGFVEAEHSLGEVLFEGPVEMRDEARAVLWMRLAAARGHVRASYNLGQAYRTGRGVAADMGEAVRWYRIAAEGGVALAQVNLGLALAHGHGVDVDLKQAEQWFSKAAAQGHKRAAEYLNKIRALRRK